MRDRQICEIRRRRWRPFQHAVARFLFMLENRGSKFGELASRLARSPRNIIVGMRLNPLRPFELRSHHATYHHRIFFEANRLQRVTVGTLHNRANGKDEFQHD